MIIETVGGSGNLSIFTIKLVCFIFDLPWPPVAGRRVCIWTEARGWARHLWGVQNTCRATSPAVVAVSDIFGDADDSANPMSGWLLHVLALPLQSEEKGLQDCKPSIARVWQDLHSLTYICTCYVLMSSLLLYQLLEESQMRTSKDTFLIHSSWLTTLHLSKRNELIKIPFLPITTVFCRALALLLLQQKDRVVFVVQEY
jgi:hypothetical protein